MPPGIPQKKGWKFLPLALAGLTNGGSCHQQMLLYLTTACLDEGTCFICMLLTLLLEVPHGTLTPWTTLPLCKECRIAGLTMQHVKCVSRAHQAKTEAFSATAERVASHDLSKTLLDCPHELFLPVPAIVHGKHATTKTRPCTTACKSGLQCFVIARQQVDLEGCTCLPESMQLITWPSQSHRSPSLAGRPPALLPFWAFVAPVARQAEQYIQSRCRIAAQCAPGLDGWTR